MDFCLDRGFIQRNCKEFSGLADDAIEAIVEVTKMLPYFVEANDSDVFIDLVNRKEGTALVIAELYSRNSLYKSSFLGDPIYRKDEPAVFQAFETGSCVRNTVGISHDKLTGNRILTKQTTMPICHNKKAIAVLIIEKALEYEVKSEAQNVTAPKDMSDILLSIIGLKKGMESQVREGILVFNEMGSLIYHNSISDKIYKGIGYQIADELHFDSLNLTSLNFMEFLDRENALPGESADLLHDEFVSIEGREYEIRILITGYAYAKLVMLIDDYPYLNKYKKEIKNHLVSYREIHHRIKNNLQTIASLLRLQSNNCPDEYSCNVLQNSINRIMSIAVTHDLLARRSGDKISIMEILILFINNIIDYNAIDSKIMILVSGDDFAVDSQKSNVILLVVNELLQNSLKYAFPGDCGGEINIIVSDEGDIKVIELGDNGVGYSPEDMREDSLGLTIVKSYVEEILEGKLAVASGPTGTRSSFAFKG